jgi:hypothetical protein
MELELQMVNEINGLQKNYRKLIPISSMKVRKVELKERL